MQNRIIIHVDVNNAFLSWTAVHKLKNGYPRDIRCRYAIIAGDESQRRGIVLAKSNLCKKRGVKTAETIAMARRKCPYLEVYPPDFNVYREYSNLMYEYLRRYSNIIERYSIDECFIDYTHSVKLFGDPVKLAYTIKNDIKTRFGFTVNIGIGYNKLCAKMASDFMKPDRVHTLFPEEIPTKMWPLDVSNLFMIGKSTSAKLHSLNINTIYDLAHTDQDYLIRKFKSLGKMMWEYAHGVDNSEVDSEYTDPKSISSSTVLPYNYTHKEDIIKVLQGLVAETGVRLRKHKMYAGVIHLGIKYSNFTKVTKQVKLANNITKDVDIYNEIIRLFNFIWNEEPIRSLTVGLSGLSKTNMIQLSLFEQSRGDRDLLNDDKLQRTIETIRQKYGNNLITYGFNQPQTSRINLKDYKEEK